MKRKVGDVARPRNKYLCCSRCLMRDAYPGWPWRPTCPHMKPNQNNTQFPGATFLYIHLPWEVGDRSWFPGSLVAYKGQLGSHKNKNIFGSFIELAHYCDSAITQKLEGFQWLITCFLIYVKQSENTPRFLHALPTAGHQLEATKQQSLHISV